ncbi:MAG: GspH/FimT family pseudopilin [Ramlibacter sp.]|nr:GspH/FimT family pseudopilin [Ramlibacter sp.]
MNTAATNPIPQPTDDLRGSHFPRRRDAGFSLIELLLVVAVAAVLLGLSAPSFSRLLHSTRVSDASNALLSSLFLARSEAIKRNSRVTLCKSATGTSCATAGGWEQGWIVFHDTDQDGFRDAGETIIERMEPIASGVRVTGSLRVERYVSFMATGLTRLVGGGFQAGTVLICNPAVATGEARQIILNAAGRLRVQKVNATQCA